MLKYSFPVFQNLFLMFARNAELLFPHTFADLVIVSLSDDS